MCTHRGGLSAMSAGGNPTVTAAAPAAGGTLDGRVATTNPRAVVAYLNDVNNMAYSRKRQTRAGDVYQTLEPDKGSSGYTTGLRAVAMQVSTGPMSGYSQVTIEHNGTVISTKRYPNLAAARDGGRKDLAIELRRRGIY